MVVWSAWLVPSAHASHSRTTAHVHRRCALGLCNTQGKKSRAQFSNWLCYELSGACKHKPPPLPKARQIAATRGLALIPGSLPLHHACRLSLLGPCAACLHAKRFVFLCLALLTLLSRSAPATHLQDRAPGPAFQPQREGEQNLERMVGDMQVSWPAQYIRAMLPPAWLTPPKHAHTSQLVGCQVHALAQIWALPRLRPVLPLPPVRSAAAGPRAAGQPAQP